MVIFTIQKHKTAAPLYLFDEFKLDLLVFWGGMLSVQTSLILLIIAIRSIGDNVVKWGLLDDVSFTKLTRVLFIDMSCKIVVWFVFKVLVVDDEMLELLFAVEVVFGFLIFFNFLGFLVFAVKTVVDFVVDIFGIIRISAQLTNFSPLMSIYN